MARLHLSAVCVPFALCVSIFAQQQPEVGDPHAPATQPAAIQDPAGGGPHDKAPLSEDELRERRIRAVDPLAKPELPPDDAQTPPLALPLSPKAFRGSVAAGNQKTPNSRSEGPSVVADDPLAVTSDRYTGPAVLSRTYTLNRSSVSDSVRWAPSFAVGATYQTGLTGGALSPGGALDDRSSGGTRVEWGIDGTHNWRHDVLRLSYHGDANRYSAASSYSGTDQTVSVALSHVASRHIMLEFSGSGASLSQSYSLTNPALSIDTSVANINLAADPLVQILDNGVRQGALTGSLVWQKSARLSFNFSGGTFAVTRHGAGLIGNTGYTSSADVNYRYTRKMTVGAYYSFSDFAYSHRVQLSNTHTVGLICSYAFSRSLEFRARVGGTRLESEGLMSVAIDPAIAKLLGQSSVIIDDYRKHYTSDVSAEIAKDFGRAHTARIAYARGVSPGNGVQLTSLQESMTAGFATAFLRRNSLDFGGGRIALSSAGQSIGKYVSDFVSIGVSHRYSRRVTQSFSAYYRTFDISNTAVDHPQLMFSMTVGWSPGENPLHF